MHLRNLAISAGLFLIICLLLQPATAIVINGNETDNGTYYYNMGTKLVAAGEFTRAINAFDNALSSNTTMLEMSNGLLYTYQGKAFAQVQLELFADAVDTANKGLSLYPTDAPLWNNKGYALFKLGRYQDAVAAFDHALVIDKGYTMCWNNKGDTLFEMGRYQDAVNAYTTALTTDPGNTYASEGLARAQKKTSEISPVLIVTVIVVIVILGAGGFYLSRKNTNKTAKDNKIGKKR
jgi:tetratricopeptide (TPR) repeat protein